FKSPPKLQAFVRVGGIAAGDCPFAGLGRPKSGARRGEIGVPFAAAGVCLRPSQAVTARKPRTHPPSTKEDFPCRIPTPSSPQSSRSARRSNAPPPRF